LFPGSIRRGTIRCLRLVPRLNKKEVVPRGAPKTAVLEQKDSHRLRQVAAKEAPKVAAREEADRHKPWREAAAGSLKQHRPLFLPHRQ
jgi:hypothetical protein